jgi:hypothetical protein
LKLNVNIENGK